MFVWKLFRHEAFNVDDNLWIRLVASVEKMITQTDNIGRSLCGCAKIVFIVNSAVQNVHFQLKDVGADRRLAMKAAKKIFYDIW